jgi:hypothetical protein
MARIKRFEEYRFLGTRDDMLVYDCDDDAQFAVLQSREDAEGLSQQNLISAISPHSLAEARNRGYQPVSEADVEESVEA